MQQIDTPKQTKAPVTVSGLETSIATVGEQLGRYLSAVLDSVPGGPYGPAELARTLGIDKVLASRALKAARNKDPMAVVYLSPGPDPLRRVFRAASKKGVDSDLIAEAENAVAQFDQLIRHEAGDRSALDAIISAWLPESRAEFELRRKQSAFKAMSQLKGAMAETSLATVMLHPAANGTHLDIVWISGLLGLQRLRPGAGVKFATRRITNGDTPRRPMSLDGIPVDSLEGVRLDEFCSSPPPKLDVQQVGEVVHYTLAGDAFGPKSAVNLVFAEVNLEEMPRYVPAESKRKGYVFAEISTPAKALHFDVFVHQDVYPGSEPTLSIYDTAFDGVASVNDPSRDIDRLDLGESIQPLGIGTAKFRTADVPNYTDLIRLVCNKLKWDGERFRGYRCRIDYPIYGTQVAMAFDPPAPPVA